MKEAGLDFETLTGDLHKLVDEARPFAAVDKRARATQALVVVGTGATRSLRLVINPTTCEAWVLAFNCSCAGCAFISSPALVSWQPSLLSWAQFSWQLIGERGGTRSDARASCGCGCGPGLRR